jgi:hypothetical protein
MSGVAGALIGLVGQQPNIAAARGLIDSTTSGRGCTTNFIGFGFGLTSSEPKPEDFVAADDTVVRQLAAAGTVQTPTYTAIPGVTDAETLSWAVGAAAAAVLNTVAANITGTAQVGQVLTAAGTWTGTPTPTLTYQWNVGGVPVVGATASTYTVVAADVGKTATVTVTGRNPVNTLTVTSAATAVIIA